MRPVGDGGYGLDALWNDDFHHSAMVALTGRAEAYYGDYAGTPQELISAVKRGYLYQGQPYAWQGKPRGTPAWDISPTSFVNFVQNHDQVANSLAGLRGDRLTSPGRYRAMTALLLLAPATPMLFQGQEFGASSPFLYFADLPPELAKLTRAGRAEFLAQFPSLAGPEAQAALPDPGDRLTFERSKLDLTERERHGATYALHVDLLRLRRDDPIFRSAGGRRRGRRGPRAGGARAPILRRRSRPGGSAALPQPGARPRAARRRRSPCSRRPRRGGWTLLWSSEAVRYGGPGTPELDPDTRWLLPGHAALVFGGRAMTDVIRRIAWPGRTADGSRRNPRVAGHERARRLRVGHRVDPDDAPVSWPPHRGAAGAVRPDVHAEPPGRAALLAGREGRGHRRRLGGQRRRQARRDGGSCRVPSRDGPSRLALRARRTGPREAPASPVSTEHGARELSARRRAGADPAGGPADRPLPPARAAGEHAASGSLRAHGRQRPVRATRNRGAPARFGFACTAPPPRFASPARRSVRSCIPWSGAGDTSPRGISGVPATSGSRSTRKPRPPSWPPPSPGRPWTRWIPKPRCAPS